MPFEKEKRFRGPFPHPCMEAEGEASPSLNP
jgi:hypothetical protein